MAAVLILSEDQIDCELMDSIFLTMVLLDREQIEWCKESLKRIPKVRVTLNNKTSVWFPSLLYDWCVIFFMVIAGWFKDYLPNTYFCAARLSFADEADLVMFKLRWL